MSATEQTQHNAACLPLDVLEMILVQLPVAGDLQAASQVCRTWHAAAQREAPWEAARRRDHPAADPATVAVLGERARSRRAQGGACAGRQVYRALQQTWTCDRCRQEFTDSTNSGSSCCYHPGILFSGGLMNGTGLRFTCCNRRAHHIPNGARDGNGCATAFHGGGQSAWQRHGAVVKPRELSAEPAKPAGSSSSSSSASGGSPPSSSSSSPSRPYPFHQTRAHLQEWHPNQRPGLLELPSRLFAVSGGAA